MSLVSVLKFKALVTTKDHVTAMDLGCNQGPFWSQEVMLMLSPCQFEKTVLSVKPKIQPTANGNGLGPWTCHSPLPFYDRSPCKPFVEPCEEQETSWASLHLSSLKRDIYQPYQIVYPTFFQSWDNRHQRLWERRPSPTPNSTADSHTWESWTHPSKVHRQSGTTPHIKIVCGGGSQ